MIVHVVEFAVIFSTTSGKCGRLIITRELRGLCQRVACSVAVLSASPEKPNLRGRDCEGSEGFFKAVWALEASCSGVVKDDAATHQCCCVSLFCLLRRGVKRPFCFRSQRSQATQQACYEYSFDYPGIHFVYSCWWPFSHLPALYLEFQLV